MSLRRVLVDRQRPGQPEQAQALHRVVGGLRVDEELDALPHGLSQLLRGQLRVGAVVEIVRRDLTVPVLLQVEVGRVLVTRIDRSTRCQRHVDADRHGDR
jgi:hypothetical protein